MRIVLLLLTACGLLAAENPLLHALITSGWNEKPTIEFTVQPNRTFVWRSGPTDFKGSLKPEVLAELISHIQAAKPGPAANDAGTLQVTWREKSGAAISKVFYFPGRMPASALIQEIRTIAERDGKVSEVIEKR